MKRTTRGKEETLIEPEIKSKVSTVQEWIGKLEETFFLTLPSNVIVKARKLKLLDIAITGYIPFELMSSSIIAAKKMDSIENWNSISQEDMSKMMIMLDKIVLRSIIEPSICEMNTEKTENSISVNDISAVDKLFIFMNVVDTTGMEILRPFRGKRPVRSDVGQNREPLREEAI